MSPLDRVEEIFTLALDRPPHERADFIAAACGGDAALLDHANRLLKAHGSGSGFLSEPTLGGGQHPDGPGGSDSDSPSEFPGARIGPYKLLQRIGEGGFGSVFMAEQQTPVVRRVALKIIKLGMDTRQVIARFEAERQALAMMDHPNIARVLDAGATETGRPYFVMELVRGDPLTRYCDDHNLSTPERLELFQQVCHAVQHAHQKGIIHRDIKPGNVLVTVADGRPIPKMIDFGIAKATSMRLTERTLFTEHRHLIGTPQYMSPEQAEPSGVDIDTRSDIYSLGVLLYELLTGTTPFDPEQLRSAAFGEVQRIIREVEPPRPSTRVSALGVTLAQVAAHRQSDPAKLSGLIRGDLDWIVMKSLEKDRARRYETADALAADITRHLAGNPVAAAPPSAAYRLRKFVRRHRVGVAAGSAVGAALVLGVIGTTGGMIWAIGAQREQSRLRGAADIARAAEQVQRELAQDSQALALQEAFHANLAAASAAITAGDSAVATERLDRIPESLRGWEWRYLRQQADVSLDTYWGHEGPVRCLTVSPDGSLIASGSDDKTIKIWDAATGAVLHTLTGHLNSVRAVAWNPTGTRIASGADWGGVGLWDAATGEKVRPRFSAHSKMVRSVAYSPDDSCFVSGGYDGLIKIWDSKTGDKVSDLTPGAEVTCVGFSPDGALVSAHGDDGTVLLWTTPLGSVPARCLARVGDRVQVVAFSPDGEHLAFSWIGGKIRICSVSTDQTLVLPSHAQIVTSLAFSADGHRLVSGGSDGAVRLWDLDTAELLATLIGHAAIVSSVSFSRDGTRIYSCSADKTLKVWEAVTAQRLGAGEAAKRIISVAFSSDGAHIAGICSDGTLRWWDSLTGGISRERPLIGSPVTLDGDLKDGIPLVFSTNGTCVASAGPSGSIELSDADTGERLRVLHGHTKVVKCLAFNHDGTRLASAGTDGTLRMWDVATGAQTAAIHTSYFPRPTRPSELNADSNGLAFSPDGSFVAWGGAEEVKVCDGTSLRELRTIRFVDAKGLSVAFSPVGSQLAVCANTGEISIWSPQTGQRLGVFPGRGIMGTRVSFSPDGAHLISSSTSNVMRVFDPVHMIELVSLHPPAGGMQVISFDPDGTRLAQAFWGGEGGVRVLDTVAESERYRERQAIRAAEQDGVRALDAATAREADCALVARRLRTDPTLAAPVRRIALNLLFARSLAEQNEVRGLVEPLRLSHPIASELVDAVTSDPTIPERLRARAIRFASQESRPIELNDSAWNKVQRPGGSVDDYRRGLIEAEEAVRLIPNDAWMINTLGVAQFRLGDYEAALATLTRADAINSRFTAAIYAAPSTQARPTHAGNPVDVAFIAMTLHHLGRTTEARAAMDRMHALMSQDSFGRDANWAVAAEEAEHVVPR